MSESFQMNKSQRASMRQAEHIEVISNNQTEGGEDNREARMVFNISYQM